MHVESLKPRRLAQCRYCLTRHQTCLSTRMDSKGTRRLKLNCGEASVQPSVDTRMVAHKPCEVPRASISHPATSFSFLSPRRGHVALSFTLIVVFMVFLCIPSLFLLTTVLRFVAVAAPLAFDCLNFTASTLSMRIRSNCMLSTCFYETEVELNEIMNIGRFGIFRSKRNQKRQCFL